MDVGLLFSGGHWYSRNKSQPGKLRRDTKRCDVKELLLQKGGKWGGKVVAEADQNSDQGKRNFFGADCEESLVLQYICLQLEENASFYAFSRWHSGTGPLCWGSHFLQTADLTLISRVMIQEPDAIPGMKAEYMRRFHVPNYMGTRQFLASSKSQTKPAWRVQQLQWGRGAGPETKPIYRDWRNPFDYMNRRVDELQLTGHRVWSDGGERDGIILPQFPCVDQAGWGRPPGLPHNVSWKNDGGRGVHDGMRAGRRPYSTQFEPVYTTKISVIQYHGCYFHNGQHYNRCVHYSGKNLTSEMRQRREYSQYLDTLKMYYCAYMQEATGVWIEYKVVCSCDMFCFPGNLPASWAELNDRANSKSHKTAEENMIRQEDDAVEKVAGLRQFLRENFYYESCLGFKLKANQDVGDAVGGDVIDETEFINWLKDSPFNSTSVSGLDFIHPQERKKKGQYNDTAGFLTIKGGKTLPGAAQNFFGFCHQKNSTNLAALGIFSRHQLDLLDAQQRNFLEKSMAKEPKTMTRLHFGDDDLEVLSLDYLRYLIQVHGLHDFQVIHVALYRSKTYLNDMLCALLRRRASQGTTPLMSHSLKLCINR